MAIELEVKCGNWTTSIEVEGKVFVKRGDMCVEAMTVAVENFLSGKHEGFVMTEDEDHDDGMTLDHFMTCDGNICMTKFILINAGRHDIARLIKEEI